MVLLLGVTTIPQTADGGRRRDVPPGAVVEAPNLKHAVRSSRAASQRG